jgi:MraZ protein
MSTFVGNIDGRLDEKGRIFVPAAYRKILAENGSKRIVMRRDTDNECLMFYP